MRIYRDKKKTREHDNFLDVRTIKKVLRKKQTQCEILKIYKNKNFKGITLYNRKVNTFINYNELYPIIMEENDFQFGSANPNTTLSAIDISIGCNSD